MADLALLRTSLPFPLGLLNSGRLIISVEGKSCSSQWIVISFYSPFSSHLRWGCFIFIEDYLALFFFSSYCCWLTKSEEEANAHLRIGRLLGL